MRAFALPAPDQTVGHKPQAEDAVPDKHGRPHSDDKQDHSGVASGADPGVPVTPGEFPQALRGAGERHGAASTTSSESRRAGWLVAMLVPSLLVERAGRASEVRGLLAAHRP
jgi:hypothetical protein